MNELFKAVHCITFINLMNLANIFFELLNPKQFKLEL